MTVTIKHPEGITGSASGMEFVDGVASVASLSDEARAVLSEHGFTFEDAPEPTEAEKAAAAKAEAERLDALPIHVGDTVKVTESALAIVEQDPAVNGPTLESIKDWSGAVIAVYVRDGIDVADVQDDHAPDGYNTIKVEDLEVVPPAAPAAAPAKPAAKASAK